MQGICHLRSKSSDLIQQSVVEECNASPFWSVMADEAMNVSTTEQLSVCVHFEKSTGALEVCEEFLGFSSIPTIGAEDIIL